MRVARVQGSLHVLVHHHLGGLSEGNLGVVEDESVSEDLGDVFELVMGSNDEVSALRQIEQGF